MNCRHFLLEYFLADQHRSVSKRTKRKTEYSYGRPLGYWPAPWNGRGSPGGSEIGGGPVVEQTMRASGTAIPWLKKSNPST
jgi:hypothetical protein